MSRSIRKPHSNRTLAPFDSRDLSRARAEMRTHRDFEWRRQKPANMKNRATHNARACRVARVVPSRLCVCVQRAVHCVSCRVRRTVCSALYASACEGLGKMSSGQSTSNQSISQSDQSKGAYTAACDGPCATTAHPLDALSRALHSHTSRAHVSLFCSHALCNSLAHTCSHAHATHCASTCKCVLRRSECVSRDLNARAAFSAFHLCMRRAL